MCSDDQIHLRGQASVGDVGVVAEITEVEFMANGRANLVVSGSTILGAENSKRRVRGLSLITALLQAKCKERFRIKEHWVEDGTQGLHWCKIEFIRDDPPADPAVLTTHKDICKGLFDRFIGQCGAGARAEVDAVYGPQPEDSEVFVLKIQGLQVLESTEGLRETELAADCAESVFLARIHPSGPIPQEAGLFVLNPRTNILRLVVSSVACGASLNFLVLDNVSCVKQVLLETKSTQERLATCAALMQHALRDIRSREAAPSAAAV